MRNGIIYFSDTNNIGDDIQTYAASLHVDKPAFCEREALDEVSEKTNLLCNGWFMHSKTNWPPSDVINPLFISFHLSSRAQELMTSSDAIAYYKRHQPIGCRDYHTLDLMKKHGVEAYFSGCLTLTLPKYEGPKGDEILFVDVMRTNYTVDYRKTVVENLIPDAYKSQVKYISHFSEDVRNLDQNTRMEQTKALLERYGKAKLVFTSMIHCALPCVALGTPVVFVDIGFDTSAQRRDRFNGIIDLFHVESNLDAPFLKRNLANKMARGLRLYHLNKDNFKQLPEELFEYSESTSKHLDLADKMKATIKAHFNKG